MNLGCESETVEFKKSTSELKEGIASVAAILNKHGHGDLFFGVKNDGDVCGMQVSDTTLREIGQAIDQSIEPRIHPTIVRLGDENGKEYVRVTFSGADSPYSCKGIYRLRVSDSDVIMSTAEVKQRAVRAYFSEHPWDSEPCDIALDLINESTLKSYVKRGNECGRITFEYSTKEDALSRLKLIKDDKLTNASAVLFSKPDAIMLKMAIFATDARINILDMRQESGDLFSLAKMAEDYIMRNIKWRFVIDGKMQRDEIPEIPQAVAREAVINAFCHRDYTSQLAVQVDIFPEKIEIFNPGRFPREVTPEQLLQDDSFPFSKSPNPLIAQTLYRSKDIESYGTGIQRIKKLCEEANVNFEYDANENGTIIRFWRPNWFAAREENAREKQTRPLDTNQVALEIAQSSGKVDVHTLAKETNTGRATASKVLNQLAQKGQLKWCGSSKNDPKQHYVINATA